MHNLNFNYTAELITEIVRGLPGGGRDFVVTIAFGYGETLRDLLCYIKNSKDCLPLILAMTNFWMSASILLFVLFLESTSATAVTTTGPKVCLNWINESCIGGERGLLSTGLWLSYRASSNLEHGSNLQNGGNSVAEHSDSIWIEYNSSLPDLTYYDANATRNVINVTFEFKQPEHGGGTCHCVQIVIHNATFG